MYSIENMETTILIPLQISTAEQQVHALLLDKISATTLSWSKVQTTVRSITRFGEKTMRFNIHYFMLSTKPNYGMIIF